MESFYFRGTTHSIMKRLYVYTSETNILICIEVKEELTVNEKLNINFVYTLFA
jgi:hypothetical protein